MKLKTSFFDFTALKKDLTRFFPIWALYLIGGLLITQSGWAGSPLFLAEDLGSSLGTMGIINLCYAALIAICLFGDLFKSKMCNALHALPVRREAWFITHVTAGMLMCLVPNLVLALLLMPYGAQFWYVPLMWLGVVLMQFLFFFGVAVFSIYLTGNGFAAALVYGLINFCSILAMWFVNAFYTPLLYGIKTDTSAFMKFSPVVHLVQEYKLWDMEHLETCTNPYCKKEYYGYHSDCQYELIHKQETWVYLAIIAVIGVALLVCSLLLYRHRKLESAGDFASVKPMKTVFTVLGSVAAGMLFWVFQGGDELFGYILLLLGGIVGFFVCQMLLQRTIKVFGKKSWGKLGILVAAIAISLGLTAVDVLGITRIVPDESDVVSVTLAEGHLSDYRLEQLEETLAESSKARGIDPGYLNGKDGMVTLTDPAQIKEAIAIHQLLLQERNPNIDRYSAGYTSVTIHYQLKNGTTLTRYYWGLTKGEAIRKLQNFTNTPAYILGVNSAEELIEGLEYIYYTDDNFYHEVDNEIWQQKLAEALYADAAAGNLSQKQDSYYGKGYVELQYRYSDGSYRYLSVSVPASAKNTKQWASEYYAWLKENGKLAA